MAVTFVGVRHHSPACAGLVRRAIAELQPAHVLIEGPADVNDRLDELLLGHELPVAVFTSYRDEERHHSSWSPFCAHSPEWVGLTDGHRAGAAVRFIDLPAWHEAFADRSNRYADADRRHTAAIEQLCTTLALDNVDTLWDHLFEIEPTDDLADHLTAYFDLIRGEAEASDSDEAREAHMAEWIRAATADAAGRPVLVITGGFHRPALVRRTAAGDEAGAAATDWPQVPQFPEGAVGGSFLVPFSFRRLDAFDGYQSGMPSPHYYQRLWEVGPVGAADDLVATVVARLRGRRQPVSTADLVAARTLALGLARLRGHSVPGRVDVLDGLVSALVTDPLDRPLPWTGRGQLAPGTDPVVVEMVAALAGTTVGRLHPDTPHPPLAHDAATELERHGLAGPGTDGRRTVALDLADPERRAASRVLHRLRVLEIPGATRIHGPTPHGVPVLEEGWQLADSELRLPRLIEAGAYGATLGAAASAMLGDRFLAQGHDGAGLAAVLFDATLCGLDDLSERVVERIRTLVGGVSDIGGLDAILAVALGLWRHDRLLGGAGDPTLARVVDAAVVRALWLVDGMRGGPASSEPARLDAIASIRDAVVHAAPVLSVGVDAVVDVFARATASDRPIDLRGAAVGLVWSLDPDRAGGPSGVQRAIRLAGRPELLGDFLAGLFAVAREQVLAGDPPGVLDLLDELVGQFDEAAFLEALPPLRLAFVWFPPREREAIAEHLLASRGLSGSAQALLRLSVAPEVVVRARAVEARVDDLLDREALLARGEGR